MTLRCFVFQSPVGDGSAGGLAEVPEPDEPRCNGYRRDRPEGGARRDAKESPTPHDQVGPPRLGHQGGYSVSG